MFFLALLPTHQMFSLIRSSERRVVYKSNFSELSFLPLSPPPPVDRVFFFLFQQLNVWVSLFRVMYVLKWSVLLTSWNRAWIVMQVLSSVFIWEAVLPIDYRLIIDINIKWENCFNPWRDLCSIQNQSKIDYSYKNKKNTKLPELNNTKKNYLILTGSSWLLLLNNCPNEI